MHQPPAARFAFPALIAANLSLAVGPWMVRLADTGPSASAFWRCALAAPILLLWLLLAAERRRPGEAEPRLIGAVALGGLFSRSIFSLWHESILRTRLANATLFGNMSSFLYMLAGFLLARALPRPVQAAALLLAIVGAALLLGGSYEFRRHFLGDLLALGRGLLRPLSDRGGSGAADDGLLARLAVATLAGTRRSCFSHWRWASRSCRTTGRR